MLLCNVDALYCTFCTLSYSLVNPIPARRRVSLSHHCTNGKTPAVTSQVQTSGIDLRPRLATATSRSKVRVRGAGGTRRRVRSVLRRYQTTCDAKETAGKSSHRYRFNNWTFDSSKRELLDADNLPVSVTSGEFYLLLLFVSSARRVLSRDQIMDSLSGNEWLPNDRAIDNQVARLRKKLDDPAAKASLIKTVRGTGYLFYS